MNLDGAFSEATGCTPCDILYRVNLIVDSQQRDVKKWRNTKDTTLTTILLINLAESTLILSRCLRRHCLRGRNNNNTA